jgi:lysophospholipase L1-like esterase
MTDTQPVTKSPMRIAAINISIAAVLLITLFILGEAAARIWLLHAASPAAFRHYASLRQIEKHPGHTGIEKEKYAPHRYIGYVPTPNYVQGENRHNSLGYRGDEISSPKPEGEFRIVCIGGSTTYTPDVEDFRLSYPAQLEAQLHARGWQAVRVINAGAESWMSYESLINFELRVLDIEPDLIIVYHGINDIIGRFVYPVEAYQSDNSGAKGPRVTDIFMPGLLEYSTLVRIWLIRTGRVLPHYSVDERLNNWQPTFVAYDWYEQNKDGNYPSGAFEEMPADSLLRNNGPSYFKRNIGQLAAIARARDIAVVLASFAHSTAFDDNPWASSEEIAWAYNESNAVLQEVSVETDSTFFDFVARFPDNPKNFTDGFHVNESGARLKAEIFADFLVESGLLPTKTE